MNAIPTSDELLLAAADGDLDAFARLHDRLAGPVRTLVRGFVDGDAVVEAVTAAVMSEAWRTAGDFDPAAMSASRWVLALARRRAIERAAAARARRTRMVRVLRRTAVGPPRVITIPAVLAPDPAPRR